MRTIIAGDWEAGDVGSACSFRETGKQFVVAVRAADAAEVDTAVERVAEFLAERGLAPAGSPLLRWMGGAGDGETWIGLPVLAPVAGEGPFAALELPAGRVATTLHEGSPDGIAGALRALEAWLRGQGATPAGPPWAVVRVAPCEAVELFRPVSG